jgi:uncharacterized protein (TIGR02246 family)
MRKMLLSFLAACVPAIAVAQGTQAAESGIREHITAYAAAINQRDAAALAMLYTPDADEVIADGPRSIGRDAIRAAAKRDLPAWPPARRFTLEVTGVRMLTPDIAIVDTSATFSEVRCDRIVGHTLWCDEMASGLPPRSVCMQAPRHPDAGDANAA